MAYSVYFYLFPALSIIPSLFIGQIYVARSKKASSWPYKLSEVHLRNMNDLIEEVLKEILCNSNPSSD